MAKLGGTNVRRARLRNRDQAGSFSGIGQRGDEASANADGRTLGDIGGTAHGVWATDPERRNVQFSLRRRICLQSRKFIRLSAVGNIFIGME